MKKKTYPLYYGGQKQKFARWVVVGDLVFLSGMSGRTMETGDVSSDDVKEQMLVALDKVRGALDEAGSSMDHIVKTTIYLKDVKNYDVMRQTEYEYWQKHAPGLIEEPRRARSGHAGITCQAEYAGGDRRHRLPQRLTPREPGGLPAPAPPRR